MKKFFAFILVLLSAVVLVACGGDKNPTPTPTLSFATTSYELKEGEEVTLNPVVTNLEGSYLVKYTSDNEAVAIVTDNVLKGLSEGSAVITAVLDGYDETSVTLQVTVVKPEPVEVVVESIEISGNNSLRLNESIQLTATVVPANVKVIWESSKSTTASVDQTGKVTGLKIGTATITATAGDKSDEIEITVLPPLATAIDIQGNASMEVGQIQTLVCTVTPNNASNDIKWSSNNQTVVAVSDGVVNALAEGTAVITATVNDGSNVSKDFTITVTGSYDRSVIIIDSTLTDGQSFTENDIHYVEGKNAFKTLTECVSLLEEGAKVVYKKGTYAENLTIPVNNVTIVGPNEGINPNKDTRVDEAIISGTIKLAEDSKGVVIDGLAFTGDGCVESINGVHNFTFQNNNIYDITIAASDYKPENRVRTNVVLKLYEEPIAGNNLTGNIFIINNSFKNLTCGAISISRTSPDEKIVINGNVIHNFGPEGIRFDGGYNSGEYEITNNTFENDSLQSGCAILFRAYSARSGEKQNVTIENNLFKNIGDVSLYENALFAAAITCGYFNNNHVDMKIRYNTFEGCTNGLYLLNNNEEGSIKTWNGTITYNYFKGIANFAYSDPLNAGDASHNYFEDAEGNPITDDVTIAALVPNCATYENYFETKEAYLAAINGVEGDINYYVDGNWSTLELGKTVSYAGLELTVGTNAFGTISEALEKAQAGETILILAGSYAEEITITKNVKLYGPNSSVNPNLDTRKEEAILTEQIKIATGVTSVVISGFSFTLKGTIAAATDDANVSGLEVSRCHFYDNSGLTVISFVGKTTTANFKFTENLFEDPADETARFLRFTNLTNLEYTNNVSKGAYDVLYIDETGTATNKGVFGDMVIKFNEFNEWIQFAMNIRLFAGTKLEVKGNTFTSTQTAASTDGRFLGTVNVFDFGITENATVEVQYNIFKDVQGYNIVRFRDADQSLKDKLTIKVNHNEFIGDPFSSTALIIENQSAASIVNADQNFFAKADGTVYTPEDKLFTNVSSHTNNYATKADADKVVNNYLLEGKIGFSTGEVVAPTAISITNKKEALSFGETYQLEYTITPAATTNKRVIFTSSDENIATVSGAGLIKVSGIKAGTVTITVSCIADEKVTDNVTIVVTHPTQIEVSYEGNAYLEVNKEIQLHADVVPEDSEATVTWTSKNPEFATVDATGKVKGVAKGEATIEATIEGTDVKATITIAVVPAVSEDSVDALDWILSQTLGTALLQEILYIGSDDGSKDFLRVVWGAASLFQFKDLEVTENLLPTDHANYPKDNDGKPAVKSSIEFITVHDTANTDRGADGRANSNWCINSSNESTSWHYTVGNDGIFKQMPDDAVAWHAADGSRAFNLIDSGVKADDPNVKPNIEIKEGAFYVNGQRTSIPLPTGSYQKNGQTITVTASENSLWTIDGLYTEVGTNGNWFVNSPWLSLQYNTEFGHISNGGGNYNSIGIESSVEQNTDVYLTWQNLAKLIGSLLNEYNLKPNRVLAHNDYCGKPCPGTMINAGLWPTFQKMIDAEYTAATTYKDYKFTLTSNNPQIMDNTGKIIGKPSYATVVSYTITVTGPNNYNKTSDTLYTIVPGTVSLTAK